MMTSVFDGVENILRNGEEKAGFKHFLLFSEYFKKPSSSRLLKFKIVLQRVNPLPHVSILGSPNSAANEDMMSKLSKNGDIII